jgi:hypothetical protein
MSDLRSSIIPEGRPVDAPELTHQKNSDKRGATEAAFLASARFRLVNPAKAGIPGFISASPPIDTRPPLRVDAACN